MVANLYARHLKKNTKIEAGSKSHVGQCLSAHQLSQLNFLQGWNASIVYKTEEMRPHPKLMATLGHLMWNSLHTPLGCG